MKSAISVCLVLLSATSQISAQNVILKPFIQSEIKGAVAGAFEQGTIKTVVKAETKTLAVGAMDNAAIKGYGAYVAKTGTRSVSQDMLATTSLNSTRTGAVSIGRAEIGSLSTPATKAVKASPQRILNGTAASSTPAAKAEIKAASTVKKTAAPVKTTPVQNASNSAAPAPVNAGGIMNQRQALKSSLGGTGKASEEAGATLRKVDQEIARRTTQAQKDQLARTTIAKNRRIAKARQAKRVLDAKEQTQQTLDARAKWKAEYSEQRAQESVKNLSGHGNPRHGEQTTLQSQITRVETGIAPDGKFAPTNRATHFESASAEMEAVGRARAQLGKSGNTANEANVVVGGRPGGYGSGVEIKNGKTVLTAKDQNALVRFQRIPKTGSMEPVTQYPTSKPISR